MSAGVVITKQPPESIKWIEKIARVVAQKGPEIEETIKSLNMNNEEFSFLWSSDHSHALYQQKLTEYRAQNQDVYHQDIQPDAPATHERVGDNTSYLEPEPQDCAFTSPDMLVQPPLSPLGSKLTEYGARNQYEAQYIQPDASAKAL